MEYVCIRHGDHHLRPVGLGGGIITAVEEGVGPPTLVRRVDVGEGLYAYSGHLNRYWRVERGVIRVDEPDLAAASRFREIWFPDDRIGLLLTGIGGGFFVSVDGLSVGSLPKAVFLGPDTAADREKFYFDVPPVGLVPQEPGSTQHKLDEAIEIVVPDSVTADDITVTASPNALRIREATRAQDAFDPNGRSPFQR